MAGQMYILDMHRSDGRPFSHHPLPVVPVVVLVAFLLLVCSGQKNDIENPPPD